MLLAPVVEIFCDIDDFCKTYYHTHTLPGHKRIRDKPCAMSTSEIICILVLFHLSHYRTLKHFYRECVLLDLRHAFPRALSYNRFVELEKSVFVPLGAYLITKLGQRTNYYYIDATKLAVCHNKRIFQHRVFKDIAQRGKTSMGWFYGFKLHIVINHKGEIVNLSITKGNIDDRTEMEKLFKGLTGISAGDKGYISHKKAETLKQRGLRFITTVKKNMKKRMMTAFEKFFLSKRGIVETVIEQLKYICQVEHTRHRNPDNFIINLLSGLVAYCLKPRKPSITWPKSLTNNTTVISN